MLILKHTETVTPLLSYAYPTLSNTIPCSNQINRTTFTSVIKNSYIRLMAKISITFSYLSSDTLTKTSHTKTYKFGPSSSRSLFPAIDQLTKED